MDRLKDTMVPVNEFGTPFRRVDYGFADPDCDICAGSGFVDGGEIGFMEACDCVVDDVHLTAGDQCPRREEA